MTADELGIYSDDICPKIDVIRRELKFTGIAGLKYYPSPETKALIEPVYFARFYMTFIYDKASGEYVIADADYKDLAPLKRK